MGACRWAAWISLLLLVSCAGRGAPPVVERPERFVSLDEIDSTIELDIRYYTSNNFVGRPIRGYLRPKCFLTREAVVALVQAQRKANLAGYSLKVYDCYRPQRAVSDFTEWARDVRDTKMQHRFYPAVPKSELFSRGYIAEKSGHSRGSTLDVTLVPLGSRQPKEDPAAARYDCRSRMSQRYPDNSIDMGTGYDCFDELAHTENLKAGETAMRNRQRLKSILESAGFVNYEKEWWHYTLRDEPFPATYFDFVVE